MGVFEITQKQYQLVMGTTPSDYAGDTRPVEKVSWNTIRGGDWPGNPAGSGTPDANTFMDKIRTKTGLDLDLPTETQWEYACRAGTTRAYNDYTKNDGAGSDCLNLADHGVDYNLESLAWYSGNSYYEKHREVGLKQANAWGLYDMLGNNREWCLDWYAVDLIGPISGTSRVCRGGAWGYSGPRSCSSANRAYYSPSNSLNYQGFRLALPLEAPSLSKLSFDGVNDTVNLAIPEEASLPSNTFTIEVIARTPNTHGIDSQSHSGVSGAYNQKYLLDPAHLYSNNAGMGVFMGTNGVSIYEHASYYLPAILVHSEDIGSDYRHITIVYDNLATSLYIDGVFKKSGLTSNRTNVYPSVDSLGGGYYGFFEGDVLEYRIWNKSLSSTEISDGFGTIPEGDESGLIHFWNFRKGTLTDEISGETGELLNGAQFTTD